MSLPVEIVDGHGTKNKVKIDEEGAQYVVVHPHPPKNEEKAPFPFRQYFTDNGVSSGSHDMLVDGSTTNRKFFIAANADTDTYIKRCDMVIADAGATMNKFGNITALSNGVEFTWFTQTTGLQVIHEGLKSNFDFVQLSGGNPSFGSGTSSFKASNVIGTSEAYIPSIDLAETFGLQWGIRLRKGTTDTLCFNIRDNVSAIDRFDVIAYGITF